MTLQHRPGSDITEATTKAFICLDGLDNPNTTRGMSPHLGLTGQRLIKFDHLTRSRDSTVPDTLYSGTPCLLSFISA